MCEPPCRFSCQRSIQVVSGRPRSRRQRQALPHLELLSGREPRIPGEAVAGEFGRIRPHTTWVWPRIGATGAFQHGGGGCRGPERIRPNGLAGSAWGQLPPTNQRHALPRNEAQLFEHKGVRSTGGCSGYQGPRVEEPQERLGHAAQQWEALSAGHVGTAPSPTYQALGERFWSRFRKSCASRRWNTASNRSRRLRLNRRYRRRSFRTPSCSRKPRAGT